MFPSVLLERLILVFAWCILPLVYGVELAGLLEDPTFSVGMISRFTRGTMDLTYLVQNFVKAGQFIPGAFRGRLLTWPASTKFWTKYVRFIVPLVNLLIIPIENVGSSSSPASSTPYIRGRIHQVKTRTSLPSKTRRNKRNFHHKSKQ